MRWKNSLLTIFLIHAQHNEKENNRNINAIFLLLQFSWNTMFVLLLPITADTQLAVLQLWFGFKLTLY